MLGFNICYLDESSSNNVEEIYPIGKLSSAERDGNFDTLVLNFDGFNKSVFIDLTSGEAKKLWLDLKNTLHKREDYIFFIDINNSEFRADLIKYSIKEI